jgi:3-oxoacyl-[acyl-carrier protein] reductase
MTYEHFLTMIQVNLIGPTLFFQAVRQQLNLNASIIFLSSTSATKGSYDPSYAAAKSGIHGLMFS